MRHGECRANVEGRTAGSRNDSPLTELGLQQADETGEKLKGLQLDLIVSSPLGRGADTAKCIAEKIGYKGEVRLEPILTERDFGVLSDEPRETALPLIDAGNVEGLESLEDFAERMMRTIHEGHPYQSWLETPDLHNGHIREYEL